MKAGLTNIPINTRIRTSKKWGKTTITGTITHPFGYFSSYDYGAIAGIRIDEKFQRKFGQISNLFKGDFELERK